MGRIIKWLFYLVVLAAVLLIAYAYAGPFLGVDFSARPSEISEPVILSTE